MEAAFPIPVLQDVERLALTNRPDLKRIQSEEAAQRQSVAIAKSSFGPRVNAFAGWEMDNPTFVAGGGGNNWLGGMEMQIDLFQGGAKRAELARERALEEKVTAMKQAASDGVRLEVRRAYYDVGLRPAGSRGCAGRHRTGARKSAHQPGPLRQRPHHHYGSSGRGRCDAPQPDRLLGGCLSVSYQLRQSRVGERHLESAIPGGDAMNSREFHFLTSSSSGRGYRRRAQRLFQRADRTASGPGDRAQCFRARQCSRADSSRFAGSSGNRTRGANQPAREPDDGEHRRDARA